MIIGGGPIGLLSATLLGAHGIDTVIINQKPRLAENSKAIGIPPPSLSVFGRLGLDHILIKNGLK